MHDSTISTYASFFLLGNSATGDIGKVLDDLFGVLSLTGTRLTTGNQKQNKKILFNIY